MVFHGSAEIPVFDAEDLIVKLVILVIIIVFVRTRHDALIYVAALTIGLSGSQIINFTFSAAEVPWKAKALRPFRHLRELKLFAPLQGATTLQTGMDKMVAGYMLAPSLLAFYTLADRLCSVAVSLSNAVTGVMLPRLSHTAATIGAHVVQEEVATALSIYLPVAILLLLGIGITGHAWSLILFGASYAAVGDILDVMKWNLVVYVITQFIGSMMLLPCGRQGTYLRTILYGMAMQIVAIPVGTLLAGAIGTAVGLTISNVTVLIAMGLTCRKELAPILKAILRSLDTWRRVGAGLLVALCFALFPLSAAPSLVRALLYSAGIVVSYIVVLAISGDTFLCAAGSPACEWLASPADGREST